MVIHPVCGATKALIRLNANHMGQQVGSRLVWSEHTHTDSKSEEKNSKRPSTRFCAVGCTLCFLCHDKKMEASPGVDNIYKANNCLLKE